MRHVRHGLRMGWAAVVLCLLWAAPAAGQQPVPSPGTGYKLAWDHDGAFVERWLLQIDGGTKTDITSQVTPLPPASFQVAFPALTPGAHNLVVCAANIAGEGCSDPFAVVLVAVPARPSSVRVVAPAPPGE